MTHSSPTMGQNSIDYLTTPWDRSAEAYAQLAPEISFYKETNEQIVREARIQPNMTVIDLACGSSVLATRHMLSTCPDLKRVYCVDSSSQMIAVAAKHLRSTIAECLVCPAESVDQVIADSIDRVVCNSAFWLLDAPLALKAVRNLLCSNGLLVFNLAEWDFDFGDTAIHPRYKAINEQLKLRGLPAKIQRGTEKKYSLEEVQQILIASGFSSISHSTQIVEVTANDWKKFYQIPTIASKSLPFLPEALSEEVLTSAMMSLQGQDLPPLRWITFSALKMAPL